MGVEQPDRCVCDQPRRHYIDDETLERAFIEAKAAGNWPHLDNLRLLQICPMRER